MQNLRIHSMSNLEASELQQLEATLVATVVNNNNKKNSKKLKQQYAWAMKQWRNVP